MTEDNSIFFTGEYPKIQRVITGFYSLDRALSNPSQKAWGIPLTSYELYGNAGVGKSTLALSLAGIVGKALESKITIAPIEALDTTFAESILKNTGYSGEVTLSLGEPYRKKGSPNSDDENILDQFLDLLADEDYAVGILDSVGAISPVAETEGLTSDANMGRRAKLMANFMRRSTRLFRFRSPFMTLVVNHVYANLGFAGSTTSGGDALKYLSRVRIRLSRKAQVSDEEEKPKAATDYAGGSYLIGGTCEKLSFGPSRRTFNVFCVANRGLHLGMSAVWDGITNGLVSAEKTIKIGEQSFGYMSKLVKEAEDGHDDVFQPFIDAISEYQLKSKSTEEPDANDSNVE